MDGLCGICVFVVLLLYHCVLAMPAGAHMLRVDGRGPAWMLRTPLSLALSGHEAVLVFFALSGFVLAYSFEGADCFRYLPFLVKRVARISCRLRPRSC